MSAITVTLVTLNCPVDPAGCRRTDVDNALAIIAAEVTFNILQILIICKEY